MKKTKKRIFTAVKIGVSLAALGNLAALFLFQYRFPFPVKAGQDTVAETTTPSEPESAESIGYSFRFESNPLEYDGSRRLDLLKGVSIEGKDGSVSDARIFTNIKSGSTRSRKIVTYSADVGDIQVSGERELKLVNYKGPSITLPETLPALTREQLDTVVKDLSESLRADDGFGNDITDSLTASYTQDDSSEKVHFTFKVTNLFNETASVQADFDLTENLPLITLSKSQLTISAGSSFNPLEYVENAVDENGDSLFDQIHIVGEVDTNTPGTYELIYDLTSPSGLTSLPKTLTVTVQ